MDAMLRGLFGGSVGHIEITGKRNGKTDEEIAEIVDKTIKDIISGMAGVELEEIKEGRTPQEARSVLPNSLKTEVVMTANLREWRHFLSLRACGSTGKPHPQMLEVAVPLLKELRERVPVVFDDLEPMEWETVK